jgi:hypothetical protein
MSRRRSRILAVEPDPDRGSALKRFVGERVAADVVVAATSEAAISEISEQLPDVILTSALITPGDDAQLTSHLRRLDGARDVPVLTIPPLVNIEESFSQDHPMRRFLKQSKPQPWPAYDLAAVGDRIEEALNRAESARAAKRPGNPPGLTDGTAPDSDWALDAVAARLECEALATRDEALSIVRAAVAQRDRAIRWTRVDMPWLSAVKLSWGLEVQWLNISSTGMLVESPSKLAIGDAAEFVLRGPDANLVVPGRIVRSDVAAVDGRGVKYRAAAAFERSLEMLPLAPAAAPSAGSGQNLTELFVRVIAECEPARLRALLERALQKRVGAQAFEVDRGLAGPVTGDQCLSVAVPTRSRVKAWLQVMFERGCSPTDAEIERMKTAAALAALALQSETASSSDGSSSDLVMLSPWWGLFGESDPARV